MPHRLDTRCLRVLLLEDDDDDALLLLRYLQQVGYEPQAHRVDSLASFGDCLRQESWDVVISDYKLPGFSALDALETMQQRACDLPFIIVSGTIDEDTACAAMRAGAQDYLRKDKLDRLSPVIERELREARMRHERRSALDAVQDSEARFRTLAANIPGVVFQMRREPDGQLRFLYVSEASQMLFGLPADVLVQEAGCFTSLLLPHDRADFLREMSACAERKTTLNWEGRIRAQAGDEKWINLRCSPVRLDCGATLWEGVMWNITHSKQSEAALRHSRGQLAELSNHLQRAKEDERERIARDIHDVLGGTLVGIKIAVSLLSGQLGDPAAARGRLRDIEDMLDDAIATAGRVARELRPGILKEFGLAAAIESYAEDFAHRTGLACRVLCADHDIETGEDTALALFRTYQEALTNVSKHAQANEIEIRLIQEGEEILLEVSDNGRGLRKADLNKPRSFGLRSIRERLHSLGGSVELRPRLPQGTVVALRVPLRGEHAPAESAALAGHPVAT